MNWNPSKIAFKIPFLGHPVAWYGLLFAIGFFIGYYVLRRQTNTYVKSVQKPTLLGVRLADRLLWTTIVATILGARLGEVFFYSWSYYKEHPEDIVKIWEGGLASHGGVIAIFISLWLVARYTRREIKSFSFLTALDLVVLPAALVSFAIRIGNFINQEILGLPTTLPWGVTFGHEAFPRHPVQLYEAVAYLALFFILFLIKKPRIGSGFLSGLFFVILFSARFLIEFIKAPQGDYDTGILSTGQLLSLPLILLGATWLYRSKSKN